MDEQARDEFLSRKPRLGNLVTLRKDGSPSAVPVWFDWDGTAVSIFADGGSSKLTHIANDARITVLVVNDVGEPEAWVAFDGLATVSSSGGFDLAEKLASRYWDLASPDTAEVIEQWRASAADFMKISIVPSKIRSYP